MHLPMLDIVVLLVYVAGVVAFGCWFVRKSRTSDEFMAAARSLPGWAVGLSIFGTFLSSNTFLGVPGNAYGGNWNRFVFSLSIPVAAVVAVKVFVPFFRRSGEISAYHHLEGRFGPWARTYAVVCYLLLQVSRVGSIMFGVALALRALTGWPMAPIIIAMGGLVTAYTLLGGIEAVIWTDVVQSLVLIVGVLVVAGMLLVGMPEGPGQIFSIGAAEGKFSLGGFGASLSEPTFWVVLAYGLVINLGNFGIDQNYVQRYHAARSDGAARRSVWLGGLLYVPISLVFFFVGTSLFAYYQTHPEMRAEVARTVAEERLRAEGASADDAGYPAALEREAGALSARDIGDKVLPHFIVRQLPAGLTGLLIAAIFAAAMSSVDTSLNSSATITLSDIYKRYFRPQASEKEAMRVLRGATLVWGAIGTGVAVAMIGVESVLDAWWTLAGTFTGALVGLFLLGLVSRRVRSPAAAVGAVVGLLVILWMSLSFVVAAALAGVCVVWLLLRLASPRAAAIVATAATAAVLIGHIVLLRWYPLPWYQEWANFAKSPFHELLTSVVGTATIILVGLLAGLVWNGRARA
ncbi:MAG: sodium:solute symporter [Planctomycetes bacterium]|nr:sodium:solute symporter [Planctomycetota bacterium]